MSAETPDDTTRQSAGEWPWSKLGLEGPCSEREVKRAYAACLKGLDRTDVEAVQALRHAFETARKRATETTNRPRRPKMADLAYEAQQSHAASFGAPKDAPDVVWELDSSTPTPVSPATSASLPEFEPAKAETHNLTSSSETVVLKAPPVPNAGSELEIVKLTQHQSEIRKAGPVDLDKEIQALEAILLVDHKLTTSDLNALKQVFDRIGLLDRTEQIAFEQALARKLIFNKTPTTKKLAQHIDAAFHWISQATSSQAYLARVDGADDLLVRLARASVQGFFKQKPYKTSRWVETGDSDSSRLTLEEIASFWFLLLGIGKGIWEAVFNSADVPWLFTFIVSGVASLILMIVPAILLEWLWVLLYPLRVSGLQWLLDRLYQGVTTPGMRRRIAALQPSKRGISLSLSLIFFVHLLVIDWLY